MAASALYQQGLARLNPGSSEARLGQYLSDHLAEELTSEKICRALSLSRTGLYYLSRQTYGCGINEQIHPAAGAAGHGTAGHNVPCPTWRSAA